MRHFLVTKPGRGWWGFLRSPPLSPRWFTATFPGWARLISSADAVGVREVDGSQTPSSILGKSDSQPAMGLGKVFIVFIPREEPDGFNYEVMPANRVWVTDRKSKSLGFCEGLAPNYTEG